MSTPWMGDCVPDELWPRFHDMVVAGRPADVDWEMWREQIREMVDWDAYRKLTHPTA